VIARARDEGALELLLTHPVPRGAYLLAVTSVRYVVLAAPLALIVIGMAAIGRLLFGQPPPWALVGRTIALSAALTFAFIGLGVLTSTIVRDAARGTIALLLLWACAVTLLDFGLVAAMLTWRLNPRAVFVLGR
jgi:ABC-type transport system involved in multi-copper enzyme maturation permease subunit